MFAYSLALNLWNPSHVVGWTSIIIMSIVLGMVHGITPDEHTWPITFSYAIGSYSTRKGLRSGLIFSLSFALQRAIASELAFLGLYKLYEIGWLNYVIYIVVGILMAASGLFIVKRKSILHFDLPFFKQHHQGDKDTQVWLNDPKPWMPAVHGFVAGWGFGAFALILYTVLSPATHSLAYAWIPGALFGLGTMLIQMLAGGFFGYMAQHWGLNEAAIRRISLKTAGNTLTWGGLAFVLGGGLSLLIPALGSSGISTGIRVHNLDSIGLPLILVIFSVLIVGLSTMISETRHAMAKISHDKLI